MSALAHRSGPISGRSNFFDEQKRRRRAGRMMSGVCLLIASGIGVILSSVVTPLLLLAAGGLLHLLAWLGIFAAMARDSAHALGNWAAGHMAHFDAFIASLDHVNRLSDLGVTIAPLLHLAPVSVPALVAAGLVWIGLRRISFRGEGGDLIARLHARSPDLHDQEEHQLANIVAEMGIAAGLPAPKLLLIDSPAINAAAVGGVDAQSSVLVTRGLLDRLDREETSGVVAHLVASIGAGDIRLTHGILAVFQTFGFFVTFLDLPFRWSAWRALGGLSLVVAGLRRAPDVVAETLGLLEGGMDATAMPDIEKVWNVIPWRRVRLVLLAPLLPLILISLILRIVLFLWTALFLGPPLALIWRNRRYAADAMAVQLTRDPDGLARALSHISGSAIPTGGEGREYCFIHSPSTHKKGGFTDRRTITLSLHPTLGQRLGRLPALGAAAGGGDPVRLHRYDMIAQNPGQALLAGFLLLLLVPLGLMLVLAVGYLTAIAMTMGLAAGLAITAGLLG
jgi:Zn-dependent protease with chaperone function